MGWHDKTRLELGSIETWIESCFSEYKYRKSWRNSAKQLHTHLDRFSVNKRNDLYEKSLQVHLFFSYYHRTVFALSLIHCYLNRKRVPVDNTYTNMIVAQTAKNRTYKIKSKEREKKKYVEHSTGKWSEIRLSFAKKNNDIDKRCSAHDDILYCQEQQIRNNIEWINKYSHLTHTHTNRDGVYVCPLNRNAQR